MKTILHYAIIASIIFTLNGCGEDSKIATIGEEVNSTLVDTNVTDDAESNTTNITLSKNTYRSSFVIKNGTLYATGYNINGALGLGDNINRTSFTSTGITDVKSVFSSEQTFIIKNDGTLWVTGKNNFGQLGLGDKIDRNTFVNTNIDNVRTVALSEQPHSFIVKNDGTLYYAGSGGDISGLGDSLIHDTFKKVDITNVKSIHCGYFDAIAFKNDGTIWGSGTNSSGQLGLGDITARSIFTNIPEANVKNIFMGSDISMLIKNDNSLYATGYNGWGQFGDGTIVDSTSFKYVGINDARFVSIGGFHTQLIKTDGTLWAAGRNAEGQLGVGDNINKLTFTDTLISGLSVVSTGSTDSQIIASSGNVFSTGSNSSGTLGLGDTTSRNSFTDTTETPDTYVEENLTLYYGGEVIRQSTGLYLVTLADENYPSANIDLLQVGVTNPLKPFDNQNITPAISTSPMTYTIQSDAEFNSFTLAKVLATGITYTFKNSIGTVIKTETIAIDCKRDTNGILSLYPTTVVYYADAQIESGGTVEISITNTDGDIELGDFTLNNSIDAGFTNLAFTHGIKDFNNYTPDEWGQIPESVKAIVTTFNVTMDVPITNYDYMVSFLESIAGRNVTVDASDSNGAIANGSSIFASLTRRVRVVSPNIASKVKDSDLDKMATLNFKVQEIV